MNRFIRLNHTLAYVMVPGQSGGTKAIECLLKMASSSSANRDRTPFRPPLSTHSNSPRPRAWCCCRWRKAATKYYVLYVAGAAVAVGATHLWWDCRHLHSDRQRRAAAIEGVPLGKKIDVRVRAHPLLRDIAIKFVNLN